jgi:hypothetical protein
MLLPSGIYRRDDIFSNAHASGSYHDLTAQLFRESPRDTPEGIGIAGDDERAVELAEQNFIKYRPRPRQLNVDRVYGRGGRPESFLSEDIAGPLLLSGSRHYRIAFEAIAGHTYITSIRHLDSRDLRKVRIGSRRGQYRFVRRPQSVLDDLKRTRIEYLPSAEVIRFEYPDGERAAKRTMREVKTLMRREDELMAKMQAAAIAGAATNNRSTWAERARRLDISQLLKKSRHTGWRISSLFGGLRLIELTHTPTTEFFSVYAEVSYRLWLARFRESVCRQFSEQVVARMLERNAIRGDGARAVPVHLRSSEEWMSLLQRLQLGDLSVKQVQVILYPQLDETDTSQRDGDATVPGT